LSPSEDGDSAGAAASGGGLERALELYEQALDLCDDDAYLQLKVALLRVCVLSMQEQSA